MATPDDSTSRPIAVSIKTVDRTPRGGTNYLGQTLANLARAGVFASPLLQSFTIVDSGSPDVQSFLFKEITQLGDYPAELCLSSTPRSLHVNAATAIAEVARRPVKWCMVMEDDLDFCDGFLESAVAWLEDHASPAHRMYVFGANFSQIAAAAKHGHTSWKYPITGFYGAQCLAWRREDARTLVGWLGDDPNYRGVRSHGHDLLLQSWGKWLGITHFLATVPSFVQHVGEQSGINNRYFRFGSWPGHSWRYTHRPQPRPREERRVANTHPLSARVRTK